MRRVLVPLALVWLALAPVLAQAPAAANALQGRWTVTAAEHKGRPFDVIKGGVMTIAGSEFEVRTASGNLLKGTLRLDASKAPFQMDLLHADGERWEAIYEVDGDMFRLNYVDARGTDRRPAAFTTSEATEATVITLRRDTR